MRLKRGPAEKLCVICMSVVKRQLFIANESPVQIPLVTIDTAFIRGS